MATTITPVQDNNIKHAVLIDLDLDGNVYYISSAFQEVTYSGNTYQQLGSFLQVGEMAEDIKTTNGDLAISLSGVEATYLSDILTTPIKGGVASVYRAFFNDDYTLDSANVYQRFKGVITNFVVEEDFDILEGNDTNTISVSCASINTILENKIAGQRTNPADRNKYYPGDQTFDRVPDLMGVNFDFGKEYSGGGGYQGGGGRGGGNRDRGGGGGRNQQLR